MVKLLITGGTGFIGSHTSLVLLEKGYDLIILDSFKNSSPEILKRISKILKLDNEQFLKRVTLIKGDIRDQNLVEKVFSHERSKGEVIEAVIHFAGLKAVGESVTKPIEYWDVNVSGTINILNIMQKYSCYKFVFSSSATLYGEPEYIPIKENSLIKPVNPYGKSKAAVETFLDDLSKSQPDLWKIISLRYFNPVAAHSSGLIGEDPIGTPNNLFPYICQVGVKRRSELNIFGSDWPTSDGTCIRDYIHVMDLAEGHVSALDYLMHGKSCFLKLNLGTGKGVSVLEVLNTMNLVSGLKINHKFVERRKGDVCETVADPKLAEEILKWKAERDLVEMCKDAWNWQVNNPLGIRD
ncbi:UDP-glucose 4-epimerase GalE [Prochlorococcus sp. AH-716-I17]|nr:UDP-glucose 4-epimerase GalE [Prochlorococcus sp. AH-716-I17]